MTMVRTWPVRTETRERNRAALLEAAAQLADEKGYAGTSLSAVATRAGLSTGAVYSIFGSKVELFLELLLQDWHVPGGQELTSEATDVPGFLEAYARHWVAGLRRGDARRAFELELELYLAALRDPRILAKTRAIFTASQERLTADLDRLASNGPPLPMPAAELARTVVAVLQGLSQMAIAAGEDLDEEMFVRAAARLALDVGATS
jgi:AcrR family transcriptional regulator